MASRAVQPSALAAATAVLEGRAASELAAAQGVQPVSAEQQAPRVLQLGLAAAAEELLELAAEPAMRHRGHRRRARTEDWKEG